MNRISIYRRLKGFVTLLKVKQLLKSTHRQIKLSILKKKKISIIANNCWGGFAYQELKLRYETPFVGLFIFAPDYIKLLSNFKTSIEQELQFIKAENSKYKDQLILWKTFNTYPIGILNHDIEIHFLHYKGEKEAKEQWDKRKKRINFKKLVFKFCDRDHCTPELIEKFDNLPFKNKICFTAKRYEEFKSVIFLKECEGELMVNDEWVYSKNYINLLNYFFKI